jgi:hypothetical protein
LHEGARGQEQAARIDVHDTVVFLVGDVLHRPRLRPNARIIDEDVDATERIQSLFAQTLRKLAIANVMFDGDRTTSQSLCAFSAVAPSMSATTTAAPAALNRSAIPSPMPRAAPVTTATRPSRSAMSSSIEIFQNF